jgi:oxygen-dependent protoporphyrinogen oxidase
LLSGVYGGTAHSLGVESVMPKFAAMEKQYGSITRGVKREQVRSAGPLFLSLRGGVGQLTEALAAQLPVVHGQVEAVTREGVRVNGNWTPADHVVLACGAPASSALLRGTEAGELLSAIDHSSAAVVVMAFRRQDVSHALNAFGFLVPSTEHRHMMACTWVTTKFPERAPADTVLLRCFLSGNRTESDAELLALCREDIAGIMGVRAEPRFYRVYRWAESLAQYSVGHRARIATLRQALTQLPYVSVIGNAFDGIGIPDCIRLARNTARSVLMSSADKA